MRLVELDKFEESKNQLWIRCKAYIIANEITCKEDIAQTDKIIENYPELMEAICDIVGYYKPIE